MKTYQQVDIIKKITADLKLEKLFKESKLCVLKDATPSKEDTKENTPSYTCVHGYTVRWYAARRALGLEYKPWPGHEPKSIMKSVTP